MRLVQAQVVFVGVSSHLTFSLFWYREAIPVSVIHHSGCVEILPTF